MNKTVVLVIMDGVGESADELGNMVLKASTPTLDEIKEKTDNGSSESFRKIDKK